jgi:hypothetical protein
VSVLTTTQQDRRAQGGWTVWETILAINIAGLAAIAFFGVFMRMQDARWDAYANRAAREDLQRDLEVLGSVLRDADLSTLDGFDRRGLSSNFSFRRVGASGYPGPREYLRWVPSPHDAPGIRVPGRIVHVHGNLESVVAERVPAGAFLVSLEEGMLVVQLSTYSVYEDRTQMARGSTSVLLRP